jgi:hypothetical protein
MSVFLGPMPSGLREIVGRWISEGRTSDPPTTDDDTNALFVYGGPGGCYLDAEGEVWCWDAWDDVVTRLEDGPTKVGLIAIAAEHRPQLAAWLPRRSPGVVACGRCAGGGWLLPPWPRLQCPECGGLSRVLPRAVA